MRRTDSPTTLQRWPAGQVVAGMKRVPLRMCVVCRVLRPRVELFRFVRKKGEGVLRPDPGYVVSGKGVYFCRSAECLQRLRKERRLRRLFLDKLSDGSLEWMLAELDRAS